MKKYLIQSIKVIAIAILIGSGTFAVSAWTAPTVNPPATGVVRVPANDTAQGVFAALNTTVFPQIKKGGLIISEENKYLVSPLSFFKKVLLPEEDTSVYVGGVGTADPTFATAANFPEDRSVPLTINMSGRSTEGAIKYVADTDACAGPTKIITDSSAFQFWNDGENDHADILAKGIRLTGGSPAAGKILISVDRDGRAVWATPRLAANGVDILFDTDTSPVGTCNPVAPIAGCTDSTATNYNPNATVDNGSCVFLQPPVAGCTDSTATNYNPNATIDNGSCVFLQPPVDICLSYELKANCYGNQQQFSSVYVPNGCVKMGETATPSNACALGAAQEIYTVQCSTTLTDAQVSNGAAAAGYPATHLSPVNQTPGQCVGQLTAWYCHTVGGGPGDIGSWDTIRAEDVTCTSPYLPQLLPGEAFSEGDIVCTENRPAVSLCRAGGTSKSTCRPGDSVCPN